MDLSSSRQALALFCMWYINTPPLAVIDSLMERPWETLETEPLNRTPLKSYHLCALADMQQFPSVCSHYPSADNDSSMANPPAYTREAANCCLFRRSGLKPVVRRADRPQHVYRLYYLTF